MLDLLHRFAFSFVLLLLIVLAVLWVGLAYLGMYGGEVLRGASPFWRRWDLPLFLTLTGAIVVLGFAVGLAAQWGLVPDF